MTVLREGRLRNMNTSATETLVETYCCEQEYMMMCGANLCTHLIDIQKRDIGVWEEIFHSIKN
jgi:hypothetical protein